jgi:hypothetical protein
MPRTRACLPIVAAVLLAASAAPAADWCFNSTSPPNPAAPDDPDILVVAQKFKLPKKGKCVPIVGWDSGFFNGAWGRPAMGTACLNSPATHLLVGIDLPAAGGPGTLPGMSPASHFPGLSVHFDLPYPALTGGAVIVRSSDDVVFELRADGVAGPCGLKLAIP